MMPFCNLFMGLDYTHQDISWLYLVPRCRRITWWPSGFLRFRPDGLELTTDRVSWSVRQFWWL